VMAQVSNQAEPFVPSEQRNSDMKKHILLIALLAGVALAGNALAGSEKSDAASGHYHGQKLAKKAKLSIDEAEAIALKTRPGEVMDRELEKEKGGSGLRYTFDIKATDATYEVGIDANTGDVLENAAEGKHKD
jgi:uncharacterized membrane protein YkoI